MIENVDQADFVLTCEDSIVKCLKGKEAERKGLRIYTIRSNTYADTPFPRRFFRQPQRAGALSTEAERQHRECWPMANLFSSSQNSYLRMLQHNIAERYQLAYKATKARPRRYVVYPKGGGY